MVYLDRGLVRDLIATIPADFTYSRAQPRQQRAPRRPAFDLRADDRRALPARSRRRAPQPDARRSGDVPQAQPHAPALHSSAHHIVEPMDHPISHRHLRITYSSMKHSDKTFMGMTTSPKNAEDVMEMCAILFGEDFMEENPVTTGNCNGNSPLVWDETMLGAMRAFCRATSRCCARPSCWAARTRRPPYPPRWRS
jgi:trimethylamine--corrinoid protein Co-methyltransferase